MHETRAVGTGFLDRLRGSEWHTSVAGRTRSTTGVIPSEVEGSLAGVVNERRRPTTATVATLHTSARDYARFVIALMNGTGLKPATAAAMLATQVPVDAARHTCLSPCSGSMSTALSWGLGVGLEKSAGGTAFWHWGENHGDTHTFMLGRGDGSGVVVFANSGNGHSIMPEVVAAALGGEHPAFAWMGYESYRAPARRVLRDVLARGVRTGELEALTESQINRIGYALLARKRVDDAVAVFRRNAERFPQSANVHDSLGEAWMTAGHAANAIASYRRSLELDPRNANAVAMLAKLTPPGTAPAAPPLHPPAPPPPPARPAARPGS